ncbi:MAG TPA: 16S rRNA (guanine(527)-N(7))-methyltransferase RsmG [Gammaproteobacteria bacterium]|nr:16S rRNA (guanine(527)-N(7))-methyltransferase RsmG [Gammaproteobacteria bacterium]
MAGAHEEQGRIAAGLAAADISLGAAELGSLADYLNLLRKWNRVYNLTGTRDFAELIDRHLVESLALAPLLRGSSLVDVGSGAGFPGIPLAIAAPGRHFVLVESRAKRARFLRHAAGSLGLANVEVQQLRVEDFPGERPFDTLLARAVAPPAKLLELIWHLTAPGSLLVFLTSARLTAEWQVLAESHNLRPAPLEVPRLERSRIVVLERT